MDTGPKQRRRVNPRFKANLLSILTFGWTLETFKMGYYRNIEERDLYAPLPEHKSSVLGDLVQNAWDEEVKRCRQKRKKPSLWKVLIKVFGQELMLYGLILAAMEFLIRLQQPLFLGLLLRYYSPTQELHNTTGTAPTYLSRVFHYYDSSNSMSWGEAVFFAFGVVFCSAVNVSVQHPYMMGVMHIGMKMRVAVCSLIYRKALKINLQAMSEHSAGLVVNLMANDVNRFDTGPLFIHYLWIGPLETVFVVAYLYREMSMPAIYGSLVIVLIIPFQIYLGLQTANYRKATAIKSDERVKLMKEIIMGIGVIKMYTWEPPFRKIVDVVRRQEVHYIRRTSYIRGIILSFMMFTSRLAIFVTVLLYVTFVNKINVESVFVLTCYYNILKQTMTLFFPQAVGQVAEMGVAIQRIRDYLLSEECDLPPREIRPLEEEESVHQKKRVVIRIDPVTLETRTSHININDFKLPSKEKVINRDDPAIKFENANSRWIVSAKMDDVEDINLEIPTGSLTTIIGSVGSGKSTLLHMVLRELPCTSGSVEVKGIVSYACQDPWLFAGSVRQNILFGQPFKKSRYMEVCKVCALERDISLFPHGDKTVVGERGVSLSGGQRARINLARAIYKEADIYLLDDPLSAVDSQVAKHIFEKCIKKYLSEKTVVLITHQLQFIKTVDQIVVMNKGKVIADGDYEELKNNDLDIINLMQDESHQVTESNTPVTTTTSMIPSAFSMSRRHWSLYIGSSEEEQRPEAEQQGTGRVSSRVYTDYFFAGSKKPYVTIVIIAFILAQLCASVSDYWIGQWSNVEDRLTGDRTMDTIIWTEQGLRRVDYVMIFGFITVATIVVSLFRAVLFFSVCMKSSIKLHDSMFECISRSPMSFFHANSSGRILNRFSKDMGAVDEMLPQAMIDCCQILLNLTGVVLVVLLTDITLLVPIVATIIIFYLLRFIYIRTTGAVKRLEGITRSPVFGHINATVMGLPTIRAFGAELLLAEEFDRHQDLHSSAWYLFITCSRAFGFFLDVICLVFILCVTFSCLMKTGVDGSNVGLVITQSISLTGVFQWGMRQSAEMENQMTSVERILEYTNLPLEDAWRTESEDKKPPSDWPQEGHIIFNELTLKYKPEGNAVLHRLVFEINPQEKIGIVGRTGAGKSSIIQALFRLAILEGSIIIDGIDTNSIGLHDLREKISIIPQEPVLFSGSLRKNLDPFDEYSDENLLQALSYVEILRTDNDDENENPLDKEVSEGGCNFSVGERQLVCLARAIINKHKILVLDEATANVDVQTDALIQTAIREHFQDCTVLTVAHRLNTVIDSNKILVLDAGRLMEYAHPHELLQNKRSYFSRLVAETGPAMAPVLVKAAAESYKKLQESE